MIYSSFSLQLSTFFFQGFFTDQFSSKRAGSRPKTSFVVEYANSSIKIMSMFSAFWQTIYTYMFVLSKMGCFGTINKKFLARNSAEEQKQTWNCGVLQYYMYSKKFRWIILKSLVWKHCTFQLYKVCAVLLVAANNTDWVWVKTIQTDQSITKVKSGSREFMVKFYIYTICSKRDLCHAHKML